jgi:hypothetical protein
MDLPEIPDDVEVDMELEIDQARSWGAFGLDAVHIIISCGGMQPSSSWT